MNVGEVGEVVNEDGCATIPLSRGSPPMSRYEARSWTDELIDTNDLAGCCSFLQSFAVSGTFVLPGFVMRFAVSTTQAGRWVNIGQFFWDDAGSG